jgi:acetoacetyl-CoA synthetase
VNGPRPRDATRRPSEQGDVTWRPSEADLRTSAMAQFGSAHGFSEYEDLWAWSVREPNDFWGAIWDRYVGGARGLALARDAMPGAEWFPGTTVNYAEIIFRDRVETADAIRFASEDAAVQTWSWGALKRRTAQIRAGLVELGVGRGDRVCAYMPTVPDTTAAFLATASLGAAWSCAAPEFGAESVVDRFRQIAPAVLLACDEYRFGGSTFDRRAEAVRIADACGARLVRFGNVDGDGWERGFLQEAPLRFDAVPFDHPLWILYSSGTTGLPKAIVHGHGGMLLEHLKTVHLHFDVKPDDAVLWFTTTGWMMWNLLNAVLLGGAAIVLYDGSPSWPTLERLWDVADEAQVTCFGTSAGFLAACMRAGVRPRRGRGLRRLRAVGSTGSPLAPAGYGWVADELGEQTWLFSASGGTDVCSALVGGTPTLPVRAGELQARALGASVEVFDDSGRSVVGQPGELVVTAPLPSMPTGFWGDESGSRLRATYFDRYPGVWRHGDAMTLSERGSAVIHGRSDATINRGGVRMGTAEIYRALATMPEIADALVVDVPRAGGSWMPLFIVLSEGHRCDQRLEAAICARIRAACSPRHVPDAIKPVSDLPRTLSGKALEVPVKRILAGESLEAVVDRDALQNPAALDELLVAASSMSPDAAPTGAAGDGTS